MYIYVYIYISIYISVDKVWSTRVASWDISQATAYIFVPLKAKQYMILKSGFSQLTGCVIWSSIFASLRSRDLENQLSRLKMIRFEIFNDFRR